MILFLSGCCVLGRPGEGKFRIAQPCSIGQTDPPNRPTHPMTQMPYLRVYMEFITGTGLTHKGRAGYPQKNGDRIRAFPQQQRGCCLRDRFQQKGRRQTSLAGEQGIVERNLTKGATSLRIQSKHRVYQEKRGAVRHLTENFLALNLRNHYGW